MPLTLTLAASQWVVGLLIVLGIAASVIMILMVLIQRPQGGGLSAAFGGAGAGSGQTAFGAKTGDALTIATITVFVLWLLIAIGLVYATKRPTIASGGAEQTQQESGTAPIAVPTDLTSPATTPPAEVPAPEVTTPEVPATTPEATPEGQATPETGTPASRTQDQSGGSAGDGPQGGPGGGR